MGTFTIMTSLLRQSLIPMILALLTGCGATDQESADDPITPPAVGITGQPIIGERIKGPATILNTVNGNALFSLRDSTLVSCGEEQDGWCTIGLAMEIPRSDYRKDTLGKGRQIIVDGKAVGVVLRDMPITTSTTGQQTWAQLTGYTNKNNIYPTTVIEYALKGYTDTVPNRSEEAFQPFIRSFALERDDRLEPYVTYFNYENWVDDPSPLVRVQLVFHGNKLIGVVHSRPLKLSNTTDHPLERGFRVAFFGDVPREVRDHFIQQFNQLVTSAD